MGCHPFNTIVIINGVCISPATRHNPVIRQRHPFPLSPPVPRVIYIEPEIQPNGNNVDLQQPPSMPGYTKRGLITFPFNRTHSALRVWGDDADQPYHNTILCILLVDLLFRRARCDYIESSAQDRKPFRCRDLRVCPRILFS